MLFYFFCRQVICLETVVFLRNGKRPVISRGLDVGKKRAVLRLTGQHLVNFPEQSKI